MAFIFRYIVNVLDNFVLFADASPFSAVVVVYLGIVLAASPFWARRIIEFQYDVLPQIESPSYEGSPFDPDDGLYNAGYNPDDNVMTLPTVTLSTSASIKAAIPGSNVGRGLRGKKPQQTGVGSSPLRPSPLRNSESAGGQSDTDIKSPSAAGSPSEQSGRNGSAGAVVSSPVGRKSDVCFFPSSNPSQRGVVTSSPDGFGKRRCVYEVFPTRQYDPCGTGPLSLKSLSIKSSPSGGSQSSPDIHLLDDQAKADWVQSKALDSQSKADIERLMAELRIDKQRIDAHYRAGLQRVQKQMERFGQDTGAINWKL